MNDEPHILLGAYILGGLDADERRRFEVHLSECPQCRRDADDGASLRALLTKVGPADLTADGADHVDGGSTLSGSDGRLPTRRNSRRWWTAGVVLAGAAAVTVGIATVTISGQPHTPTVDTFAIKEVTGEVTGMVTLTPRPWGTAISLDLQKLPTQGVFTLRTMDDHGQMQPAANWSATPSGVGVVQGATSIPMSKLRKLNVVDANNTVLATMER